MARKRPTTLPIGTISEGTLRPEDLIPAYLDALEGLRLAKDERQTYREVFSRYHGCECDGTDNPQGSTCEYCYNVAEYKTYAERWDGQSEDLGALAEILESHVPDYCYFGTLEGDGACFGVFPSQELLSSGAQFDDDVKTISDTSELKTVLRDYSYALHVNDHGNVTLYRRAGNRWIEVWSVV